MKFDLKNNLLYIDSIIQDHIFFDFSENEKIFSKVFKAGTGVHIRTHFLSESVFLS